MERKAFSGIMLTLLLLGMLTLAFDIQQVKSDWTWTETIFIMADGNVDPDTAPISTVDNNTYTFTDNIYDEIVVEKDNIVVDGAGYTLQGTGSGKGVDLTGRSNVTIKNMEIKQFVFGIYLNHSSSNSIIENNFIAVTFECIRLYESSNNTIGANNLILNDIDGITLYGSSNNFITKNYLMSNYDGIRLYESSNNSITENIVIENYYGIFLASSSDNNIVNNNVTANHGTGISLYWFSNENRIVKNHITSNNFRGMRLNESSNNVIYHNNFVDNTEQVHSINSTNVWDDGYPSGGNYWSDYAGADLYGGPDQNLTEGIGSDGIGDTPYVIDSNNLDHYPLMIPWTSETLLHPLEGQYANYTIRIIDSSDGTILDQMRWNLTYHKYVSPFLIYVMSWIDLPHREWDWTALNITNRYVYHFNWLITGRIGDMWFPGWIETNITTSSTIKLLDGTATVVGDKIVKVNSRPIDCWELLHIEESTIEHTFWYDKTTGLLIGQEAIMGSLKVNTTLVDANIVQLMPRAIGELKTKVEELGSEGEIDNQGIVKSLIVKLNTAQKLIDKEKLDEAKTILTEDFIPQVQNLSGIHITVEAADILIKSAEYIMSHL